LHRYITGCGKGKSVAAVTGELQPKVGGLYKLNALDPTALKPPGFNPLNFIQ
jgi:hypothetical protein